MKEILEKLFESNKNSKFVKSSQDIENIFNKMFVISPFKVLQKQIKEVITGKEIIFGLEETSSGFIFTSDFFIIVGGSKGLIKYDYFFLPKIETRQKTLIKNGSYLLDGKEIIPLGTKSEEFFKIFDEIKLKISEVGVEEVNVKTQSRSTEHTLIGTLTNIGKRGEEEWEVEKIVISKLQENFQIDVVKLDTLELLLKENQKTIINNENGKEYLHKIIRVKNYLQNLESLIDNKFKETKSGIFYSKENLRTFIRETRNLNKIHGSIFSITLLMVNELIEENFLDFYSHYELLDNLGIFNSNYEDQVLMKLTSIEDKLDSINSKLRYMNILQTYNTYQLHKIKINTSK